MFISIVITSPPTVMVLFDKAFSMASTPNTHQRRGIVQRCRPSD